jgi:hypothetical protein
MPKNTYFLALIALVALGTINSCGMKKHQDEMSVKVYLPGDPDIETNYDSDTSHYNVYNVTYKKTLLTQIFVLGTGMDLKDIVSIESLQKIDTLQTNVRLKDVN